MTKASNALAWRLRLELESAPDVFARPAGRVNVDNPCSSALAARRLPIATARISDETRTGPAEGIIGA
jgi:hypothetical protein